MYHQGTEVLNLYGTLVEDNQANYHHMRNPWPLVQCFSVVMLCLSSKTKEFSIQLKKRHTVSFKMSHAEQSQASRFLGPLPLSLIFKPTVLYMSILTLSDLKADGAVIFN
jgi:hypothetical protein